jgi:hypothetical protein
LAVTRTLALLPWLVSRLLARKVNAIPNDWAVVLCSPRASCATPRTPRSTSGHCSTPPGSNGRRDTFRKTAATWLDEDGVSGRQVANQLGHAKPSMTMDRTVTESAAQML